jgi:transposase InsO family protein
VFGYIELLYDANRRHSTLGMLSPVEFERISQSLDQQD